MATPEEYGIDVNQLVEVLARANGISFETPHHVTPGTAKALAKSAVLAAFAELPATHKPNLPEWDEVVLVGEDSFSQPGTLRQIDGTDMFSRIQQGIQTRIDSGEVIDTMPDLVGPTIPEARIRSSQYEEGTVA